VVVLTSISDQNAGLPSYDPSGYINAPDAAE